MVGHFINGRIEASGSENIDNINPATNEVIDQIPVADPGLVEKAVQAGQKGLTTWSNTPVEKRAEVLRNAARLLRENNDRLAKLEVLDSGKPLREALTVDVTSAADCLNYFASIAETMQGEYIEHPGAQTIVRRIPLGVCLGIGAWNYPIQIASWKSAPALAAGNSFIFKPSEMTPTTAVALAEIYQQAGLPDGVFNVVQGDHRTGQALVDHPQIAKVSLTGEVQTGRIVMANAAKTLKKVTLELGGKSPLIIFDDANLKSAVFASQLANFYTQGEICSNGTRVFVHSAIYERFVDALVAETTRLTTGDPMSVSTHIGALISRDHLQKVTSMVEQSISQGAKVLLGGEPLESEGNFYPPTILACDDHMTCAQEEVFGPVLSLLKFDDENDVVKRANNTQFGLAAGIFTQDISRVHRVTRQLQAGMIWVNNYNINPISVPFGGVKQSGLGRENGWAAIDEYTQRQSVYIENEPVSSAFLD